jgi:hypothetical protein
VWGRGRADTRPRCAKLSSTPHLARSAGAHGGTLSNGCHFDASWNRLAECGALHTQRAQRGGTAARCDRCVRELCSWPHLAQALWRNGEL